MKKNINLYSQSLHPKLRLLSLPIVLILWLVALIFVVLLNYYFLSEQQHFQQKLTQLNNTNQQQLTLINALQAELGNLKADPALINQVAKKQQAVSLKKRVYDELITQQKSTTKGFANLMFELAENHKTGIWLTRIYLNEKVVTIEGAANKSSSIPAWINSLGETRFFEGQEFANTRIYRDEDQQIHFVLATAEDAISFNGSFDE